jgi:LysM repeat protein
MVERSPARLLAPLALVAFVVALVLVVSNTEAPQPLPGGGATTTEQRRPARRTYVVKPGDNLTTISEKTRIRVERLRELNPALDPMLLVPGQRVKLRP